MAAAAADARDAIVRLFDSDKHTEIHTIPKRFVNVMTGTLNLAGPVESTVLKAVVNNNICDKRRNSGWKPPPLLFPFH